MSLGGLLLLLTATWCSIYILHHYFSSKNSSLLPTLTTRPRLPRTHWHTTLTPLHLRITTTRWNAAHDRLCTFLSPSRRSLTRSRTSSGSSSKAAGARTHAILGMVYTLGTLLCALGMLLATSGLLYVFFSSGWTFLSTITASKGSLGAGIADPPHLLRRALALGAGDEAANIHARQTATPPPGGGSRFPTVTPIIPGVTVPLGDLPLIVLAVFLCQIIHELGHAIAAARESLPILSAGFSLTLFLPSFFVSFPSSSLSSSPSPSFPPSSPVHTPTPNTLPARARARIIAAGPFHNLLLYLFLLALLHPPLRLAEAAGFLGGYINTQTTGTGIEMGGKVVVSVSADSPLSQHIPPGALITHLDDTPLSSPSADVWTEYLLGSPSRPTLGWCIPTATFDSASDACCPSRQKHTPSPQNQTQNPNPNADADANTQTCFVSPSTHPSTRAQRQRACIDPVPLMTIARAPRCKLPPSSSFSSSTNSNSNPPTTCAAAHTCALPHPSAQLLRITFIPSPLATPRNLALALARNLRYPTLPPRVGYSSDAVPSPREVGDNIEEGASGYRKAEARVEKEKNTRDATAKETREDAEEEAEEEKARVLLWNGPRAEVYEQVKVSNWLPRLSLLPLWLPPLIELFWSYTTMATLSLYLFNLLPLPHLDGTQLLDALLDLAFSLHTERPTFAFTFTYELDALEGGALRGAEEQEEQREKRIRTRKRWKAAIMQYVPASLGCVVLCCVLLGVVNAVVQ